ncbi:hypothetical protein [Streptomyces mirabilis]|uniref:hypothetical protein n=1 Tax=Streptomyces mirabilis TaxID=68239 RepID=UPI0036DE0BE3
MRAAGDHAADWFADQGLAALGETAGEVVVAVLGGEVTDQVSRLRRDRMGGMPRISGSRPWLTLLHTLLRSWQAALRAQPSRHSSPQA